MNIFPDNGSEKKNTQTQSKQNVAAVKKKENVIWW